MRIADQALYMAKRQGRDRVIRADEWRWPLAAGEFPIRYRCGSRSNAGMPSGTWWNGCLSMV